MYKTLLLFACLLACAGCSSHAPFEITSLKKTPKMQYGNTIFVPKIGVESIYSNYIALTRNIAKEAEKNGVKVIYYDQDSSSIKLYTNFLKEDADFSFLSLKRTFVTFSGYSGKPKTIRESGGVYELKIFKVKKTNNIKSAYESFSCKFRADYDIERSVQEVIDELYSTPNEFVEKLTDDNSLTNSNLGQIFLSLGMAKEAKKSFQNSIISEPESPDVHDGIREINHYFSPSVELLSMMQISILDYFSNESKQFSLSIESLLNRNSLPPNELIDSICQSTRIFDREITPSVRSLFSEFDKQTSTYEILLNNLEYIIPKLEAVRNTKCGFYWDYYIDYLLDLHKTEHFKTALSLMFYKNRRMTNISKWIDNNSDLISNFHSWHNMEIAKLKKKIKDNYRLPIE